jgi:uncharacterized protein (DUF1499 family)
MRARRSIAKVSLGTGLALAALGFGLRAYMNRAAQDRLLPGERAEIAALRSPLPKPSFLACPPGYCGSREAAASPLFAVPRARLHEVWRQTIAALPRVVAVAEDARHWRSVYVAHTALFGFPDVVTVEFLAPRPGCSSIALFGRSRYGRSDFGMNRRRIEHWLGLLQARVPPVSDRSCGE